MLVSGDKGFIEKARFLSQQARDPAPHYEHSTFGYDYRMSNILAAIGRGQLRVLDKRVDAKRRIFAYYKEAIGHIPGIEFMPEANYGRSNHWLTVTLIRPEELGADREALRLALEDENIEARPMWPPARRAYASERSQCIFNLYFDPQITPVPSSGATGQAQITRIQRIMKIKRSILAEWWEGR